MAINTPRVVKECLYCHQPMELQTIDSFNTNDDWNNYSLCCSHKDKCLYLSAYQKNATNLTDTNLTDTNLTDTNLTDTNLALKEYHLLNLDFLYKRSIRWLLLSIGLILIFFSYLVVGLDYNKLILLLTIPAILFEGMLFRLINEYKYERLLVPLKSLPVKVVNITDNDLSIDSILKCLLVQVNKLRDKQLSSKIKQCYNQLNKLFQILSKQEENIKDGIKGSIKNDINKAYIDNKFNSTFRSILIELITAIDLFCNKVIISNNSSDKSIQNDNELKEKIIKIIDNLMIMIDAFIDDVNSCNNDIIYAKLKVLDSLTGEFIRYYSLKK